ncbi:MAG TPA: hypothetical protein VGM23_10255, partial [Armatimonadota bacterium]
ADGPAPYREIHHRIDGSREWLAPEHISLPKLIADHMVLQRDMRVPIWGRAKPQALVTVEMAGQQPISARVNKRGCWRVLLAPMAAGGPFTLTITCGEETKTLTDVLVGEVWLGAGQSNMTWALAVNPELGPNYQTDQATQDFVGKGDFPLIRVSSDAHHLVTPNGGSWVPMPQVTTRFLPSLMTCAAILLQRQLNVPVGIIVRSFGGTTGVSWVDRDSFENDPNIKQGMASYTEVPSSEKEAAYRQAVEEWKQKAAQAREKQEPAPPAPNAPQPGVEMWAQGSELYAHYVTPVLPYAVRGIVWDQGESGTGVNNVSQADMLYAIAHGWRAAIGNASLPFIYIRKDQYNPLAAVTARMSTLANTWMVDNEGLRKDLHPPDKLEYAKRLVQVMTEKVYGGAKYRVL